MDIYLINLDRSTDRLAAFQSVNRHVIPLISRISAVDGSKVKRAILAERGIITPDLRYRDGALGNALSHLALWDKAIQEGRPLTICEDDAIFNQSFTAVSNSVLEKLPPDWHLILWGWNFDSSLRFNMIPNVSSCVGWFDQKQMRQGINAFKTASLRPQAFRLIQAFGTVCYSVSPAGAHLMRQRCLPIRNIHTYFPTLRRAVPNFSIDVLLNSNVYPHANTFVSFPPLVVTKNEHEISTIRTLTK